MALTEHKTTTQHYFEDENGRWQGEYRKWLPDGQLIMQLHFVDSRKHGECKWWHENGQLEFHAHYVDDDINGEYIALCDDGVINAHGIYMNGKELPFPDNLTDKEKFLLTLRDGIQWL